MAKATKAAARKRTRLPEDETPETPSKDQYGLDAPVNIPRFSSGCRLLDKVLGGGWAFNRIANVVGDRSTGKTLVAIEACANFMKAASNDGDIDYIDTEAAFDITYAQSLGLPLERIKFPNEILEGKSEEDYFLTIEEVHDYIEKRLDERVEKGDKKPILFVIDSADALSTTAEESRDMGAASFGDGKGKAFSEFFRRITFRLASENATLLIISQIRENVGVSFGEKHKRSGGKALDFYASQVLWLANAGQIKKTKKKVERTVGVTIKALCKKNKTAPPFRNCTFPLLFDYGIEDTAAGIDWLISVDRTDELGLSATDAKKLSDKLDRLTPEDYAQERTNVAEAVEKVWAEVESEFTPKRRKYA